MSAGGDGTTTSGEATVVVDVSGYRRPDLLIVDTLARIRLVAWRLGAPVTVRGAGSDLARLLELVGLLAVIPLEGPCSQLRGEPEPLEEAAVHEVVDVAQPSVPDLQHLDAPGLEPPTRPTRLVLGEGG
jgi:STAS domain